MIHILWCTLRPQQFKEMHAEWIKRADKPENIQTYVAVNWEQHSNELKEYLSKNYLVTKCENQDIVIFASDDFMAPQSWDAYLISKFENKGDIGLMVRDGYQLPDSSNMLHPAITIPIMTYGCLLKLNRTIYHPAYNHMFSDCELYNNLKDLNLLFDDRINDDTTFEHLHYAAGKRQADGADQAYNGKWQEDEQTWNIRKLMPVEERLLTNR